MWGSQTFSTGGQFSFSASLSHVYISVEGWTKVYSQTGWGYGRICTPRSTYDYDRIIVMSTCWTIGQEGRHSTIISVKLITPQAIAADNAIISDTFIFRE